MYVCMYDIMMNFIVTISINIGPWIVYNTAELFNCASEVIAFVIYK